MRVWKYFIAGAACAGAFVYLFQDVTELDIIAANEFVMPSTAEYIKAGDLVTQKGNGDISKICNAVLSEEARHQESSSGNYYNRLDRFVWFAARTGVRLSLLTETWVADLVAPRDRLFVGHSTGLAKKEFEYESPANCPCAIAQALAKGDRVCNVNASLSQSAEVWLDDQGVIHTRLEPRSLAVSLASSVTFVPEETFRACGIPYSKDVHEMAQSSCGSKSGLTMDVILRKKLNLIAIDLLPGPVDLAAAN